MDKVAASAEDIRKKSTLLQRLRKDAKMARLIDREKAALLLEVRFERFARPRAG